jgi:hypothetical protein
VRRAPKSRLAWDTWSECSCCGRWRPSREIRLTRKYGYRCRLCDGGDYDRDDIYYVYPANEGTRDTTSPLTNFATQGLDVNDLAYNQFLLRDQSAGTVYLVTVGPDTVTWTVETDPDRFDTIIWRSVSISSAQEMSLIIVNGELEVSNVVSENVSSATTPLTVVPPGGLDFNPPPSADDENPPPVVVIPPTPTPCVPVLAGTEPWEALFCGDFTVAGLEGWETA